MDISELAVKLIILLIPGALAALIVEKLAIHTKWNEFKFIIYAIIFGSLSYLVLGFFGSADNFWQNLPAKEIPFDVVWKACIAGILIGFISVAIDTHKLISKLARKLKISNKYGDENLYSYFLGSKEVNEVYVRDKANNLTYWGFVDSYSETEEASEIVLRAVRVYDYETSDYLYDSDKVYLSRKKDEITIELPYTNLVEENGTQKNK